MSTYGLRRTIKNKLDLGTLRGRRPATMLREYGDESLCDGCDEPMHAAEVKYEMRYREGRAHFMHPGCSMLWEVECRRQGSWNLRE
jgi:hypothetical protein